MAGIGSDPASSASYIAARGRGEAAVQQDFPGAILIRPAVMCGPDDAFLTTVVSNDSRAAAPVPAGLSNVWLGETRLQPVDVENVAQGIARVLFWCRSSRSPYEFTAPRVYTYEEPVKERSR